MKSTIIKSLIVLIGASLLFSSCATILGGSKDNTKVRNGYPPNASVYYNGNHVGEAPTNVRVPKNARQGNSRIEIKADGYESATIHMTRKVSVGYTILDIATGGIWLIIDFATGNIYKPRPNMIDYRLILLNNEAVVSEFEIGDKVVFSEGKYENVEGEIKAVYPNRALIQFNRKPNLIETIKAVGAVVEDEIVVPLGNIAKLTD